MRDTASLTALGAALMRAVHTRTDTPRLIDDPWADRLLTAEDRAALWSMAEGRVTEQEREQLRATGDRDATLDGILRAMAPYGSVILRTRYAEDSLETAVRDGTGQYVIIGAGLDSFALRRPPWAARVAVFEVDHPATQRHKRARFDELGITPSEPVHFVAGDLAAEGLGRALVRSPYRADSRAFFAWLGVTPYLTRQQNLATLRAVASSAPAGSELVFTYTDQRALDAPRSGDDSWSRARSAVAAAGEPWLSGFDPSRLEDDVQHVGLELVEDLGGDALHDRYLTAEQGPYPRPSGHIARVRVA